VETGTTRKRAGKPARSALAATLLAFVLCAAVPARAEVFERNDIITNPTWQRFSVCYDNGCARLDEVALTEHQWNKVRGILASTPESPAEERERLRAAIALMERYVGRITDTWQDKGGTFNFSTPGQMDCIDESINTTMYLTMFQRNGLIRHHHVSERATRGWFIFGWPHTTAVIRETASNERWAVDSWFLDNGQPPYILPLGVWRAGWQPED
jgi:hypothetical protein